MYSSRTHFNIESTMKESWSSTFINVVRRWYFGEYENWGEVRVTDAASMLTKQHWNNIEGFNIMFQPLLYKLLAQLSTVEFLQELWGKKCHVLFPLNSSWDLSFRSKTYINRIHPLYSIYIPWYSFWFTLSEDGKKRQEKGKGPRQL